MIEHRMDKETSSYAHLSDLESGLVNVQMEKDQDHGNYLSGFTSKSNHVDQLRSIKTEEFVYMETGQSPQVKCEKDEQELYMAGLSSNLNDTEVEIKVEIDNGISEMQSMGSLQSGSSNHEPHESFLDTKATHTASMYVNINQGECQTEYEYSIL